MKLLYTAFLFLFSISLFSQVEQLRPVEGNPVLRSHSAKEKVRQAEQVKQLAGFNPMNASEIRNGHCPPDLPTSINLVESGSTITVQLDTFGLTTGASDTVFTLLDTPPLTLGSAVFVDTTLNLSYTASAGFTGVGEETVLVELKQGSQRDTIATTFTIKRKGQTVVLPTENLDPEEMRVVCLDGFLDFPSPLNCADLIECEDDYAGEGNQLFYLSSLPGVDTCLIYQASRFPGVDTVCILVCDDLGVCDEFKIPFDIAGQTFVVDDNNPFFDDFSSYPGPYPSPDYWLDKHTFVNTTFADNPPSVGFVTFDGLDQRGSPYDILNVGIGDRLTSQRIDLTNFAPNDALSLRYFIAPKGFGVQPNPADSLILEFLNDAGEWVQVATEEGIDTTLIYVPPFEFRGIEIDDPQFLHDEFQFRFVANVSPGGYGDWWHLDYVFLGAVDATNMFFNDLAFSKLPNNFLANYSSLPFRHFKQAVEAETGESIEAHFFNTFDVTTSLEVSSVIFRETTTGSTLNTPFSVTDGNDNNILSYVPESRQKSNDELSTVRNGLENLADADFRNVEIEYSMEPNVVNNFAIDNDTVRLNVPFSNYFAHDDGTAELSYFIFQVQGGEQVAQGYHTNVADELHAVQIMFPHFLVGDPSDQLFTLKVWVDANKDGALETDEEVFTRELLRPFFADEVYDTLQGFTTYILDDFLGDPLPVSLAADQDFYVGWQYGTAGALSFPVGYDVQNECDSCLLSDINGTGFSPVNLNPSGVLMVRPVMEAQPFNTSTGTASVARAKSPISVYPNPTDGLLNLRFEKGNHGDFKIVVFNQLGQLVSQPRSASSIDLRGQESGVYFLQISDLRTGDHYIQRVVLQ